MKSNKRRPRIPEVPNAQWRDSQMEDGYSGPAVRRPASTCSNHPAPASHCKRDNHGASCNIPTNRDNHKPNGLTIMRVELGSVHESIRVSNHCHSTDQSHDHKKAEPE